MDEWTEEWPTEGGWWWFYGDPDADFMDRENRLMAVQVYIDEDGDSTCTTDGRFIYDSQAEGVWQKMDVPNLPDLEDT